MSLFRPEALRHRQGEWLGSLQLSQPLPLAWVTAGVVVCVLALGLFLAWGQGSRRVHVSGVLTPAGGLVRIVPPQVARVQRLVVQEGQRVQAGQLLMTLAVGDPRLAGTPQGQLQQTFDARLQSLADTEQQTRRVAEAEQQSLSQRIEALQRELQQLEQQVQFHQQRLALAEQAQARLESLAGQQFVSTAQVQAKQEEVMGLRADGAALLRQRASLSRDLAGLQAQARELPAQTAQQLQGLARQRDEIRETATRADPAAADRVLPVTAPMAGTVTAIYAGAGQAVSDEFAMASLWPAAAPLQAHLYAPSSALGFVRPGQPVRLRLQAFPYQKYGWLDGTVSQVAQAPAQATELAKLPLAPAAGAPQPLYRIVVTLSAQTMRAGGQAQPLQPGMQLDADIQLERRRLIEWVLEPLLGWRQRW
ncbi:HlyD family efflux transporter periplasmic adaptor subunit [Ideonella oryzae]|uniref:HlyD family efflux transporter periplasmic adaptor subunit n=1 Tax=Ideonella oryzae TaxID=2937441 RepID=A0ABT1BSW6_9BURK|nr:HlyD family efflux transporter periplasmic adaptor subunit [Ideonella oryzae]MCO5978637.1 HlyD family efflux transporter periplasmic adaptor subunit [Ideonella oryzae]